MNKTQIGAGLIDRVDPNDPMAVHAQTERRSRLTGLVVVAGGAAVLGALAHSIVDRGPDPDKIYDNEKTVTYTVQPGDTAWDLGEEVEARYDGQRYDEPIEPFVEGIVRQVDEDGMDPGDKIQLPGDVARQLEAERHGDDQQAG